MFDMFHVPFSKSRTVLCRLYPFVLYDGLSREGKKPEASFWIYAGPTGLLTLLGR